MMTLPIRRSGDEASQSDPLTAIGRLNEQLQDYLNTWSSLPSLMSEAFTPLADVEETDDAYLVEIELPGVKRDDISVEVAGRRLTLSGDRKEHERVGILRRRTRTVGRFHYEVVLPGEVAEEEVGASLDQGVLTVRVPKPEGERARRIPVK